MVTFKTSQGKSVSIKLDLVGLFVGLFGVPHLGTKMRLHILSKALEHIKLPIGSQIFDAGCGYGFSLRQFPTKFNLVGADIDKERLALARKICPQARFIIANMEKLPFKKNQFGLVLCFEVLEHIKEDQQAVRELTRVMKKDGWLIISFPDGGNEVLINDPYGHVRSGYSPEKFASLIAGLKLKIVEIYPYGKSFLGQGILAINVRLERMSEYLAAVLCFIFYPFLLIDELLPLKTGTNYVLVLRKQ